MAVGSFQARHGALGGAHADGNRLHHDLLLEALAELLREEAPRHVGRATRRVRHDQV